MNYSGAAIKKRQAALKDALVKLFEASTHTVETEMQYSELDENLKNEGHNFSSKSVIPCVQKTFPGVLYAWRSKTFNPILDGVFGHPILDGGGGKKPPTLTLNRNKIMKRNLV